METFCNNNLLFNNRNNKLLRVLQEIQEAHLENRQDINQDLEMEEVREISLNANYQEVLHQELHDLEALIQHHLEGHQLEDHHHVDYQLEVDFQDLQMAQEETNKLILSLPLRVDFYYKENVQKVNHVILAMI